MALLSGVMKYPASCSRGGFDTLLGSTKFACGKMLVPTYRHLSTVTLDTVLSDANKTRSQGKLNSVDPIRDNKKKPKVSKAAVLVPLCTVQGEPSVLFTLRSSQLTKHRGEVRFVKFLMDQSICFLLNAYYV